MSESSVKWDYGNSSLVLKHHSLGSSYRLQILHLLFQFYLEFLLIDKFLVRLNIVVCFRMVRYRSIFILMGVTEKYALE